MKRFKLIMLVLVVITTMFTGAITALALPTSVDETTLSSVTNSTTIVLTEAIGIKACNTLVINPGTATEERVVVSVVASTTITLSSALVETHIAGEVVRAANPATAPSINEHDATISTTSATASASTTDSVNFQGETASVNLGSGTLTLPVTSGPHGRFTSNTNGCGRCHQLHRAPTQKLIRFSVSTDNNPIYGVCTYCHSFNGQSTYDVKNGMIWDTNDGTRYATNGGGFEKMLAVEGKPEVATLVATTSSHRVSTALSGSSYVKFNAPGGYSPADGHVEFKCSSCHQPHGTKNSRLLVTKVATFESDGTTPVDRNTDAQGANAKVIVKVNAPFADESTEYNDDIVKFCIACHYDYNSSSASSKTGTYDNTKYRHEMGMTPGDGQNGVVGADFGFSASKFILPLASIESTSATTTSDKSAQRVVCITCHYAHGTFAKVEGIKTYDTLTLNASTNLNTDGGTESSKNLRLDNRGVCQNCHNRTASTVKPQLTDVLDPAQPGTAQYGITLLTGEKAKSPEATSIIIRYNQHMADSAGTLGNYSLAGTGAPSITAVKLSPDRRTVVLTTGGVIPTGNVMTVTVTSTTSAVTDLNGNTVDDSFKVATFTK